MEQSIPVFTTENECQDCYKCVRHCHCKAIRIVNGKASVIPEACVSCGQCVRICPAHAKKIRSDLNRLRFLLGGKERIFASIAPSYVGYFPEINIDLLAEALKKAGFEGVSETALGAEAVSAETCDYLRKTSAPLVISSACPAVADYIRKYKPQYTSCLIPFSSPVLSHCRMLRKEFGNDIKVVFFGPCAAKKNESDRNQGLFDLALTFADLEDLLEDHGITIRSSAVRKTIYSEHKKTNIRQGFFAQNNNVRSADSADQNTEEKSKPDQTQLPCGSVWGQPEEGRFYSIEGGMNDTLRDGNPQIRYIAVSGLDNLARLLHRFHLSHSPDIPETDPNDDAGNNMQKISNIGSAKALRETSGNRTIFLEALACPGGCVSGPVMPAEASALEVLFQTDRISRTGTSAGKRPEVPIDREYREDALAEWIPTEPEIEQALARVGKYGKADELNCGACGYNTCRDFARALLQNKAEEAMCHNYLRKNYQRTSNALIKYIPAGVVIVDEHLQITECNRFFAELTGDTVVFDSLGNLDSISIQVYLPEYADLFASVLENGGEIEKYNQNYQDKIINLSVFTIARGKYAGAVITDVTRKEFQREQIAAKAREVIQKNVLTVQKVARLFGEHIAETEIMLHEIAGSYEAGNGEAHE